MSPIQTSLANGLEVTRRARQLFRSKKYQELLDYLQTQEETDYLHSLKIRAEEIINKPLPAPLQDSTLQQSTPLILKLKQKTEERKFLREKKIMLAKTLQEEEKEKKKLSPKEEGIRKSTDSLNALERLKFERDQKKKIEEIEALLVTTLEKKEQLTLKEKENASESELQFIEEDLREQEKKLAQNVQAKLLPNIDKRILPGLDTYVQTVSASDLSGDVYDFVPNEDETFFYIADVTGHGTAAGLVMTMISCLANSVITRTNELISVLSTLNKEIKPKLQKNMFATMIMCKWHTALRELSLVGAGHGYVLYYSAQEKTVQKIKTGGIAVGMMSDLSKIVKEIKMELHNNDVLLLFTDGLNEAWDREKINMFGLDRLIELFQEFATQSTAEEIGKSLLKKVQDFQGEIASDDITIMVFKRVKSADEVKIKNDYQKKALEKDLLKDEVIIESKNETFSPELSAMQKDFVSKAGALALIQIDNKNYYEAQEILQKALKFDPGNQKLLSLYDKVEALIFTQEDGFLGVIKRFLYNLLKKKISQRKEFEEKKAQLLSSYYQSAEKALKNGDFKKAEEFRKLIKSLDPKSPYLKKLDEAIIFAKARITTKLDRFFSLDPVKTESSTNNLQNIESQNDFSKKKEGVSFKAIDNQNEQSLQENEILSEVNAEYNPSTVVTNEDILGLKNLLKLKDSFIQKNEIKDFEKMKTEESPKEIKMEWMQGSGLERRRKPYNKIMAKLSPMNAKDLFDFIQKVAAFIRAGIPLPKSLEIIQEQSMNDGYIYVLDELNNSLDAGKMLSEAMEQFPKQFPEMLRYLVVAGEKSGALSLILSDLAEKMKEQQMIASKIKGAMIYPSVIITVSLGMITSMLIFIVPKLTKIYRETGVELPRITEVIVKISEFIQHNYYLTGGLILSFIMAIYFFGRTSFGIRIYHKLFLTLPVVKSIVMQNNTMLFVSNLSILLENGIQLAEALTVVSRIVPNFYYKEEIIDIRKRMIAEGISLSRAMGVHLPYSKRSKLFPLEVIQAVSIGEETGSLAKVMGSSGEMFKERLKTTVKGLSDLMEPFLMIFVGVMVATILLSIMLPLFNLGKVIRKQ